MNNIEELKKKIDFLNKRAKYGITWESWKEPEKIVNDFTNSIPYLDNEKDLNLNTSNSNNQNLLIKGDNFHILNILNFTHKNKIDLIYIDPPYNTGNNDFIYNDKFISDEDGYRHTKWLNFMQKRLQLSVELLSDDGLIFISIDANEFAQLKLLCDSIFGEKNFIENFIWVKNSTKNNSKTTSTNHEYILCYCKDIEQIKSNGNYFRVKKKYFDSALKIVDDAKQNNNSNIEAEKLLRKFYKDSKIEKSGILQYKFVSEDFKIFRVSDVSAPAGKGKKFDILHPITGKPCKMPASGWRWKKETFDLMPKDFLYFGKDENTVPQEKRYLNNFEYEVMKSIIFDNTDGAKELENIFGNKTEFDYPKPTTLINTILKTHPKKEMIVLDYFAGTGTTGHAVWQTNKFEGTKHSFILVTNNEGNIFNDYTYPRLKTVATGIDINNKKYGECFNENLNVYSAKTITLENIDDSEDNAFVISNNISEIIKIKESIFSNNISNNKNIEKYISNNNVMFIYKDIFSDEIIRSIYEDCKKYKNKKILIYLFSLGDDLPIEIFQNLPDLIIELKSIPIEYLKKIKLNKEEINND